LLMVGLFAASSYKAGLSAQIATAGATYVVAPHLVGLGFGFAFFWLLPILFILLIVFGVFRGGRRWYGRGWYGSRGMYDRGYRDVSPPFYQGDPKGPRRAPAQAPHQHGAPPNTPPPPPRAPAPPRE